MKNRKKLYIIYPWLEQTKSRTGFGSETINSSNNNELNSSKYASHCFGVNTLLLNQQTLFTAGRDSSIKQWNLNENFLLVCL